MSNFDKNISIWQEQLVTPRYNSNLLKLVKMVNEYVTVNGKVLEIGCGISKSLEKIKEKELFACDISENMLGKNTFKGANYYNYDALNLPGEWKEKFDGVFCNDLIHHIEDKQKLINNIKMVLKRGGLFIFIEPSSLSLSGIYYYIKHLFIKINKNKVEYFVGFIDEKEKYLNYFKFKNFMESNGFSKIEYGTRQLIRLPPLRILKQINIEMVNDKININPFGTTVYGAFIKVVENE